MISKIRYCPKFEYAQCSFQLVWLETPTNPMLKICDIRATVDMVERKFAGKEVTKVTSSITSTTQLNLSNNQVIIKLAEIIIRILKLPHRNERI